MKKLLSIMMLIFIATLSILSVGCEETTVTPPDEPVYVFYYFDVGGLSQTEINPVSVQVGKPTGEFALPEDVPPLDGYQTAWFIDEDKSILYDPNNVATESITLYLGYAPRTYNVFFVYDNSLEFVGEFPTTYVHGQKTPLPQINLGEGYQKDVRWVYGSGDKDYYTSAIPENAIGDITLTFSAQPIYYYISYRTGIDNVEFTANDNPEKYDVTMGTYVLKEPTVEGKVFKYWVLKTTDGKDPLRNTVVKELDLQMFKSRLAITLFAVWE